VNDDGRVIPIVRCQHWDDPFDEATACRKVTEVGRAYCAEHLGPDAYIPPYTTDSEERIISDDPDEQLRGMLIDWPEFWANGHGDAEWIAEPVIAAKRSTALFAPGGTGKSLLSLWLAAHIATGTDPFTGTRQEPVDVLYLDYEMTADDLAERLEQMGFDETTTLEHLHYALLPSLPGLDRPEGGKAVVRLAELVGAELVIIDTFGRAVHGDENDADTVRAWYRWTGLHLKHAGRAFLRVDHAGKDLTKGQRGTSAKNDDVDVVWQMTVKEASTFTLKAKKRRMGWIAERVDVELRESDLLSFALVDGITYPAGTKEVADRLDTLEVEPDAGYRVAASALRAAGNPARAEVVRAAQKYRRSRVDPLDFSRDVAATESGTSASGEFGTHPEKSERDAPRDAPPDETANPQVDGSGLTSGRTGTHPPDASGTHPASLIGTQWSQRETGPVDNSDDYSDDTLFHDYPGSPT
jgi:hypothetical protein